MILSFYIFLHILLHYCFLFCFFLYYDFFMTGDYFSAKLCLPQIFIQAPAIVPCFPTLVFLPNCRTNLRTYRTMAHTRSIVASPVLDSFIPHPLPHPTPPHPTPFPFHGRVMFSSSGADVYIYHLYVFIYNDSRLNCPFKQMRIDAILAEY